MSSIVSLIILSILYSIKMQIEKMGEHELSITDAELAISYGAPENTRYYTNAVHLVQLITHKLYRILFVMNTFFIVQQAQNL